MSAYGNSPIPHTAFTLADQFVKREARGFRITEVCKDGEIPLDAWRDILALFHLLLVQGLPTTFGYVQCEGVIPGVQTTRQGSVQDTSLVPWVLRRITHFRPCFLTTTLGCHGRHLDRGQFAELWGAYRCPNDEKPPLSTSLRQFRSC